MKAEERQELKTNDLLSLWQRHGNKVLLVLAGFFLVLAYVRYQRGQAAQRQAQTMQALAAAWDGATQVVQLSRPDLPASILPQRTQLVADVNQSAQLVLNDASATPAQAANALLAQGQVYWALAHTNSAGAATSQPSTQPAGPTPAQARDLAAAAYGNVVNKYPTQHVAVTIARYALAALAEERGEIDAARNQYKALIETANFTSLPPQSKGDGDAGQAEISMAEQRLKLLNEAAKPALLLPAGQPAAVSASTDLMQSLDLGLAAGPTTAPAKAALPASGPSALRPATQP